MSNNVGKIDEEKSPYTPKSSMSNGSFMTDKCVSETETEEHLEWMRRDGGSVRIRTRGRVLFESHFPDSFCGLSAVRFSSNGEYLAAGFGSGAVQVRTGIDGNLLFGVEPGLEKRSPVEGIRFHPVMTDHFFTACADGRVFYYNTDKAACIHFCTEHNNELNALDVNLTGEFLATGGKDGTIRIYDAGTGEKLIKYSGTPLDIKKGINDRFHHRRIFSIRFHPHMEHTFVSGGVDEKVLIWDVRDPEGCVRTIFGPKLWGDALDLKDNKIITGSWEANDSLQLWDLMSGDLISTINPLNSITYVEGDFLYAAQFFSGDPCGDMVVTGGLRNVQIISLESKMMLGYFHVPRPIMTLDSWNRFIAYGGKEPVIRIAEFA